MKRHVLTLAVGLALILALAVGLALAHSPARRSAPAPTLACNAPLPPCFG